MTARLAQVSLKVQSCIVRNSIYTNIVSAEFPGILIGETIEGTTIYINDDKGEIGVWSYKEIINNPQSYLKCLKALMFAAKYGPILTRQYLNELNSEGLVVKSKVICNICGKATSATSQFSNTLIQEDKTITEYQCSEKCYVERKIQLNFKESRNGFIEKLQEAFRKY